MKDSKNETFQHEFRALIIVALDTKGILVSYLQKVLDELKISCIIMDIGFRGIPGTEPDISREAVAKEMGKEISEICCDKAQAIEIMAEGAEKISQRLLEEKKIDGVISIGGCVGTIIACQAIKSFPIGFPKIIISTMPYDLRSSLGNTDIMFLYSVADVMGLNPVTRILLEESAVALAAMIKHKKIKKESHKLNVGITCLGVTTTGAMQIYNKLLEKDVEVTVFHANGVGGSAFESAAKNGMFDAIIDFTTHEINHCLFKTPVNCPVGRMESVTRANVPYIFVPGGLDIITQGSYNLMDEENKKRLHYVHSPHFTHIRVNQEEAIIIAKYVAERINNCTKSVAVCIPLKGFSDMNREGSKIYNEKIDKVFIDTLKYCLNSNVIIKEVDAHINDEDFTDILSSTLLEFIHK